MFAMRMVIVLKFIVNVCNENGYSVKVDSS